jgi:hypothetical protein
MHQGAVNLAIAALRGMRGRLHARAFELNSQGRAEAAQALWAVVEELDHLINTLDREVME